MEGKQLVHDGDAVSPVVGVILMVAVTVILAAVAGSFVLGLGEETRGAPPQAGFEFEYADDNGDPAGGTYDQLRITHVSGATIDVERLSLRSSAPIGSGPANGSDPDYTDEIDLDGSVGPASTVSAGDSLYVSTDVSEQELDDLTVRIVYTDVSGTNSVPLATWNGN